MTTFAKFAKELELKIETNFLGIGESQFEWMVTLVNGTKEFVTPYKMGFAHCKRARFATAKAMPMTKELARALKPYGKLTISDTEGHVIPTEPTLPEVLACLHSDASSGEHLLFEDFASENDLDTDSRKAEQLWRTCQETRGRLMKFFGSAFEMFMSCTEEEEEDV